MSFDLPLNIQSWLVIRQIVYGRTLRKYEDKHDNLMKSVKLFLFIMFNQADE